jgi:hypothetical protein
MLKSRLASPSVVLIGKPVSRILLRSGRRAGAGTGVRWDSARDHRGKSRTLHLTGSDLIAGRRHALGAFVKPKRVRLRVVVSLHRVDEADRLFRYAGNKKEQAWRPALSGNQQWIPISRRKPGRCQRSRCASGDCAMSRRDCRRYRSSPRYRLASRAQCC